MYVLFIFLFIDSFILLFSHFFYTKNCITCKILFIYLHSYVLDQKMKTFPYTYIPTQLMFSRHMHTSRCYATDVFWAFVATQLMFSRHLMLRN